MNRRLVKVLAWLVIWVFVVNQTPSSDQDRSRNKIEYKSKSKVDVRAREALKLGKRLVVALPGILAQFKARRRELLARGGGDAYPQAGVAALLDSTEASLQKEFKKKDFAPLRNHIADVFDNARSDLGLPTGTALRPSPAPQATLASLHLALVWEAPEPRLDRSRADRVLDVVVELLADLRDRAAGNDLTVDLCVVSHPDKAKVVMLSPGGREIDPTKTNGRFKNLMRGKYSYKVERRSFPKIERSINLYDHERPLLSCELKDGDCAVEEGWSEACRGRRP